MDVAILDVPENVQATAVAQMGQWASPTSAQSTAIRDTPARHSESSTETREES